MRFSIRVPLETSDYFTTVRLAVGGLCAEAGLDMDGTEDFKVCVTESMLILKRNGYSSAELSFDIEDGVKAYICGNLLTGKSEGGVEDEISFALLGALIDGADIKKSGDIIEEIILSKSL